MPDDPPTVAEDLVAWGSDDEPRRAPLSTLAARLGTQERNLIVGLAGGGALLAGLSLVAAWQVATMPANRPETIPATVDTSVAGLDGWGTAYLVGLLGLTALAALALFGSAQVRGPARTAGLGWAAGLLALLAATAASLDQPGATGRFVYLLVDSEPPTIRYGAGPFLALAGVALVTAALYLHPQEQEEPAPATAQRAAAQPRPATVEPGPQGAPGGPVDLTVTEVTPFVHLPQPDDRW